MPLFYRLTYHRQPDPDDFRSQAELGRGRPRDLRQEDWEGVSLLDSAEAHHYLVWRPANDLVGYVTNITAVLPLEPMEPEEEPE